MLNKYHLLESYNNHRKEEWQSLERILLTVDGGVLGLTVSFFTNHVGSFVNPVLLRASWVLLAVSLIFLLASYAFSEYFNEDIIRKISRQDDALLESTLESLKCNWAHIGIYVTNYGALTCSIFGVIALVAFGIYNIS